MISHRFSHSWSQVDRLHLRLPVTVRPPPQEEVWICESGKQRERVFTESSMSVVEKHTAVEWWEWGVLVAIKVSCRPPDSGTYPGHALCRATISSPLGVRTRQLPAHVWGEWKWSYHPRAALGHLLLTLVRGGTTRIGWQSVENCDPFQHIHVCQLCYDNDPYLTPTLCVTSSTGSGRLLAS